MKSVLEAKYYIIDMDGVLWHGDRPVPGLVEFFELLNKRDIRFVLATNNASKTPAQFRDKLARMGVDVAEHQIITSAVATAAYLNEVKPQAKVFCIGEDGLVETLTRAGFIHCTEGADFVIVGMDRDLSWEKLALATLNVRAGARLIGTNRDATFPTERGLVHGNGAIVAALEFATEVKAEIIGKPEPIMYIQAMQRLQAEPSRTLAVGDRLETDVLGAIRAGIASVFLLSGVSTLQQLARCDYQPNFIYRDLQDFTRAIASA
ncbi:MAG: HAD-IIA family hydrolase [Acidobacteriota bacterium]|nr:HAD-IIA family hydrolase [Blastocatellia bacterium]MDW8412711.1 HAD-IIA family hydrolase [Acidobacteriota bacterium]